MQRMERDAQTYGTGKLSPTPYQTLAPVLATTKNGLRPKPLPIAFKWSGREDLNLRPPAPKAWVQFINPYFI